MLKILPTIWKLNILSCIEYRASFLIQVVGMFLNDIVLIYMWYLFFQKFQTIGGLTFNEYIPLVSLMCIVFAWLSILFGGYWKISELIVNGGLDSYILLPKNILFKIISSVLYVSAIGDLFFGLALLIFLYKASLFFILKILALSLIGSFAMLGFMVFFQSLSFFIGSSRELSRAVFDAILGPSFYPPKIFEGTFLKIVFMTVIPVFFTTFLPYKLAMDFSWNEFLILCFLFLIKKIRKRKYDEYKLGSRVIDQLL
ncbi:MAG: ABC-2 family transporter protein [Candidatus Gracilibacteria bacterium]|nr:ABC-2 family transporter protein [Candidatus Gracilibacteria bacterium]